MSGSASSVPVNPATPLYLSFAFNLSEKLFPRIDLRRTFDPFGSAILARFGWFSGKTRFPLDFGAFWAENSPTSHEGVRTF